MLKYPGRVTFIQLLNNAFLKVFEKHRDLKIVELTESTRNQEKNSQIFIFNEAQFSKDDDSFSRISQVYITFPLAIMRNRFLVTRGLSYTPAEKMILPFDRWSWILIISSVAIGFIVIGVTVHIVPKSIKHLTIGEMTSDPSFNLVRIVFGMQLTRVATGNCARLLVMIFILFCMVMRTAYQAKSFEFVTGNVRKSTPSSVQELLDRRIPIIEQYDERHMLHGKLKIPQM